MLLKTLACLTLIACGDLSIAAELGEPQLLALVADPPGIAAGESSMLSVLVAGPDGIIAPTNVRWTLPDGKGATLVQDDGWSVQAPISGESAYIRAEVSVELEDGTTLLGHRTLLIGEAQLQPAITGLRIDGESIDTASLLLLSASTHELTLDVEPAPNERAIFSWFSNIGELKRYRHSPASFETKDAESGLLLVVYRDGNGGIVSRTVEVEVR